MRKRADKSSGVALCFFLNLAFNFEWVALALLLWGLNAWLGLPIYFAYGALGIWLALALGLALLAGWLDKGGPHTRPPNKNINPYSDKNSDYLNKE